MTPMHALCQFRPIEEIRHFLSTVPELRAVIGESNVKNVEMKLLYLKDKSSIKEMLKQLFHSLMTADATIVRNELTRLTSRLSDHTDYLSKTIVRVSNEFPGDVGVLCVYFMNLLCLQPGEAIFLEPNEPHAYLLGDCVECMACSDNVVRAGLTPKFKDVDTLVNMLTFNPQTPQVHAGILHDLAPGCTERVYFLSSIAEFQISKISIRSNLKDVAFANSKSAAIFLVLQGKGTLREMGQEKVLELKTGTAFFVYANTKFFVSSSNDELILWKATVNESFLTNTQPTNDSNK